MSAHACFPLNCGQVYTKAIECSGQSSINRTASFCGSHGVDHRQRDASPSFRIGTEMFMFTPAYFSLWRNALEN